MPSKRPPQVNRGKKPAPPKVLMIDVGGTSVKMMASGHEGYRKFESKRRMSASEMVKGVLEHTEDWAYEVVSIGFPGLIRDGNRIGLAINRQKSQGAALLRRRCKSHHRRSAGTCSWWCPLAKP